MAHDEDPLGLEELYGDEAAKSIIKEGGEKFRGHVGGNQGPSKNGGPSSYAPQDAPTEPMRAFGYGQRGPISEPVPSVTSQPQLFGETTRNSGWSGAHFNTPTSSIPNLGSGNTNATLNSVSSGLNGSNTVMSALGEIKLSLSKVIDILGDISSKLDGLGGKPGDKHQSQKNDNPKGDGDKGGLNLLPLAALLGTMGAALVGKLAEGLKGVEEMVKGSAKELEGKVEGAVKGIEDFIHGPGNAVKGAEEAAGNAAKAAEGGLARFGKNALGALGKIPKAALEKTLHAGSSTLTGLAATATYVQSGMDAFEGFQGMAEHNTQKEIHGFTHMAGDYLTGAANIPSKLLPFSKGIVGMGPGKSGLVGAAGIAIPAAVDAYQIMNDKSLSPEARNAALQKLGKDTGGQLALQGALSASGMLVEGGLAAPLAVGEAAGAASRWADKKLLGVDAPHTQAENTQFKWMQLANDTGIQNSGKLPNNPNQFGGNQDALIAARDKMINEAIADMVKKNPSIMKSVMSYPNIVKDEDLKTAARKVGEQGSGSSSQPGAVSNSVNIYYPVIKDLASKQDLLLALEAANNKNKQAIYNQQSYSAISSSAPGN